MSLRRYSKGQFFEFCARLLLHNIYEYSYWYMHGVSYWYKPEKPETSISFPPCPLFSLSSFSLLPSFLSLLPLSSFFLSLPFSSLWPDRNRPLPANSVPRRRAPRRTTPRHGPARPASAGPGQPARNPSISAHARAFLVVATSFR